MEHQEPAASDKVNILQTSDGLIEGGGKSKNNAMKFRSKFKPRYNGDRLDDNNIRTTPNRPQEIEAMMRLTV